MKEHRAKVIIILLMLLIVGVPFLLQPSDRGGQAAADTGATGGRLIIFTPHNEQIRFEFGRAFNDWRIAQGKAPIVFDWRASGGTSDLRKAVLSQFEAAARSGLEDQGIGADLFFGGGEFEHNQLVDGVTVERDGVPVTITASIPAELPPGLLEEAFPQPRIGGEKLYHPDGHWVGVVLASFGIVYNRDVLGMLDLPEPETWADLADPRYAGWGALADPGHSGSIAVTYDTILRRLGWTEGWVLLRRTFGNARYFTASSSKVPVDVSAGEAAAGMCIDFYGRFQAGAVNAWSEGEGRVGYVDPPGLTATTADPISVLRGAPSEALAHEFVAWLLTPEAQRLWQLKLGEPGGPRRFELRRQPIRRDLYTPQETASWTDPEIDPFGDARPYAPGTPSYYNFVAPVSHAMAIDVHADLAAAWRALQRTAPDHPNYSAMLDLFDRMPPELTLTWPDDDLAAHWRAVVDDESHPRHEEAIMTIKAFSSGLRERYRDADRLLNDRIAWTLFFRDNYRQIVKLAGD